QGFHPCIVDDALEGMVGAISLPVPAYSALKYKGRPRYAYARAGIAIEQKIRDMSIYSLKLLYYGGLASIVDPVLKIEMDCASGTYARSVAEEIGRRLGLPATLQDLRRTRIGPFSVSDAQQLASIEKTSA
ncbi:MAG: tRNA pseudouridine(55) synthase TruB, partial [Patescibacteria group bacterium]